MLSANIYEHGKRMFEPYKIFTLGDVKVGVMGLTTEDAHKMVHPDHVKNIEFRSVIAEASQVVPELRRQADVVIATTHMGHFENGQHGTQAEGDVEMARAVNGIDLVVGGHSQNPACMKAENVLDRVYVPGTPCQPDRQNGTWIVQAHEWGKYVGRADFEYRNREFKLVSYALIPVNLKKLAATAGSESKDAFYTAEIAENKEMLALLAPYQTFGQQKLDIAVGESDQALEGKRAAARARPVAMGVLIGQAMMERTGADFAIINAGSVRDTLPAGKITYKDVLKVHPFGNTIVTVDLSGAEVLDYLNTVAKMTPGSGAFPQFAGIELVITSGTVTQARIKQEPLDPARNYRLAVNNFQAVGGDGYPKLTGHPSFVDSGFVDADVLREFIADHSPLKAASFEPGQAVVRR
jgi:5'-nucleotidase/UDP-sugar diphosphatase